MYMNNPQHGEGSEEEKEREELGQIKLKQADR